MDGKTSYLYNERTAFPAASTIKIFVLLELFNQIRAGKRQLDDFIEIPNGRFGEAGGRTSSGVLKDLESIPRISLKDAATLMIIVSDNVATNLLIDLLGMEKIQDLIRNLGLKNTKFQRKMMDVESVARGLENISTPYDMMITLEQIGAAKIFDSNTCDTILNILSRAQDVLGFRRLIPENVVIEHKTGEISEACHDVGIVRIPGNPVIICVMTKGANLVQRWDAIAEIGKLFYDHVSSENWVNVK